MKNLDLKVLMPVNVEAFFNLRPSNMGKMFGRRAVSRLHSRGRHSVLNHSSKAYSVMYNRELVDSSYAADGEVKWERLRETRPKARYVSSDQNHQISVSAPTTETETKPMRTNIAPNQ